MDKTHIIFIFLFLLQTFEASQLYIDDDSLMVVSRCGRLDLFKDSKGAWKRVKGGNVDTNCQKEPIDLLSLCKHAYPDKNIVNVAEMDYEVSIPHWCLTNDKTCIRHLSSKDPQWRQFYKVNTTPWKCLNSTYENKALPVPETCRFDHLSDMKMCASSSQYINQARRRCEELKMSLRQQSPLQSCGIDKFVGIEFVCCPANNNFNKQTNNNNKQIHNKKYNKQTRSNNKQRHNNNDNEFNIISRDNDDDHHRHHVKHPNFITKNHLSNHHEERNDDDDDDDDSDGNDDDDIINYDHHRNHKKHTSDEFERRPMRGSDVIDAYLKERKASEGSEGVNEHELYETAKLKLAAVHKRRLKKLYSSLREAHSRAHQHSDPRQVTELKNTIYERFQKMLEAEEVEHSVERLQLSHLHEQQVRKKMQSARENTMKLYLQTIDHPILAARSPYKVVSALQRHIKSLHKDRLHTIRHYNHTDASYAETIREESANHIASLDKELAQAVLLLDGLKIRTKEFVLKEIASSIHDYHLLDASFMVKVEKEDSISEDSEDLGFSEGYYGYEYEDDSSDDDSSDDVYKDGDRDSDDVEKGRIVKSGDSVEETPKIVSLKERNRSSPMKSLDEELREKHYSNHYEDEDEGDENEEKEYEDGDEEEDEEGEEDDEDDEGDEGDEDEEEEESDSSEEYDYNEDEDEKNYEEDSRDDEEDGSYEEEDENKYDDDEYDDDEYDDDDDDDEEEEDESKSVDTNHNVVAEFEDYRDNTSKNKEDRDDEDEDDDDDSSVASNDADTNDDTFVKNKENPRGSDYFKKDSISMQQNQLHSSKKFPSSSHTNFGTAIPLGVTVGTLTVAVVIIVGVLVMQRRGVSGAGSGYIKTANRNESDTLNASPEEKHLEGMQVNGYENPTYKYFERCQSSPPAEA